MEKKELYGRNRFGDVVFGAVFAHNKRAQFGENIFEIYFVFEIRRTTHSVGHTYQSY